jgi:hypothetical protein
MARRKAKGAVGTCEPTAPLSNQNVPSATVSVKSRRTKNVS